ncbi:replicative DNA helicase [Chitinophaga lutea]|nr:replicative DNA helicase [Chitinophaga lutea]
MNRQRARDTRQSIDIATMVYGKVPPQSKGLEEMVLGACMLEPVFTMVSGILTGEAFYLEAHQHVYGAMVQLAEKALPIDIMTVTERLRQNGNLELVGGPYALVQLTNTVVSSANVEAHARIILQKHLQRELIRAAGEILNEAYEDTTDVFDLLESAEMKVMRLSSRLQTTGYKHISTLATQAMKQIDVIRNRKTKLTGVPTGFSHLDEHTNGWQPGDLIILAGRPGKGKTQFALNLLMHAAQSEEKPTPAAYFSLEMSGEQLTPRILSASSQVPLAAITRGTISDKGIDNITRLSLPGLYTAPIFIDDSPGLNIQQLKAKARLLYQREGVRFIIVDYLQLMSGSSTNKGNREQEISAISRQLKVLALELKIPILALSQLSRDVEKRKGKPQLSDLRESGAIEQDADMVLFVYRPEEDEVKNDARLRNTGQVLIRKYRNGQLGDIDFRVYNEIQSWMTIDDGYDYEASLTGMKRVNIDPIPTHTHISLEDKPEDLPF